MMHFCMDMASAVTIFPDMLILSISRGTALISLLFSRQASVANVMPVLYEYADTISGLRPLSSTVPRSALPSTQIISLSPSALYSLRWNNPANSCILSASASSSIPCSTRQRVASDGTPFFSMPNWRNFLRLCLPNSIISVLPTHFEARASIISMMMSSSLWRIFPLSDLLKSGTDEENSFSLYKILSREPNLFTTFMAWLCAFAPIKITWSSGLIWFITICLSAIKLRKICHSTYLFKHLFRWKSKKAVSSEAYLPIIESPHELWTVRAKSALTIQGNTHYKITTFLSEQRNLKWKSREKWRINFPSHVNNPINIAIFVGVKRICKWHLKRFGYYLYSQAVVEWI